MVMVFHTKNNIGHGLELMLKVLANEPIALFSINFGEVLPAIPPSSFFKKQDDLPDGSGL